MLGKPFWAALLLQWAFPWTLRKEGPSEVSLENRLSLYFEIKNWEKGVKHKRIIILFSSLFFSPAKAAEWCLSWSTKGCKLLSAMVWSGACKPFIFIIWSTEWIIQHWPCWLDISLKMSQFLENRFYNKKKRIWCSQSFRSCFLSIKENWTQVVWTTSTSWKAKVSHSSYANRVWYKRILWGKSESGPH